MKIPIKYEKVLNNAVCHLRVALLCLVDSHFDKYLLVEHVSKNDAWDSTPIPHTSDLPYKADASAVTMVSVLIKRIEAAGDKTRRFLIICINKLPTIIKN